MSDKNELELKPTEHRVVITDEQKRYSELRRALLSKRDNYRMFISGLFLGITGNTFVSATFELAKNSVEGIQVSPLWFNVTFLLFGLSLIAIIVEVLTYFSWMNDINRQLEIYLPLLQQAYRIEQP